MKLPAQRNKFESFSTDGRDIDLLRKAMGDVDEKVRIQIKQDKKMEKQREIITAPGCDYLPLFFLVKPEWMII